MRRDIQARLDRYLQGVLDKTPQMQIRDELFIADVLFGLEFLDVLA